MPHIGDIVLREKKESQRKNGVKRNRCIWAACEDCGKERWILLWEWKKGLFKHCQLCSLKHMNFNKQSVHWGADNWKWKGGRRKRKDGYIDIRVYPSDPFYPMAHKSYIPEHRLVMARALSRLLNAKEFVHHKDGDSGNNQLENLELCTANNHKLSYRDGYKQGFADGRRLPSDLTTPIIKLDGATKKRVRVEV